jgi:starch-binding outer membrane protein, SusD/RagB family
MNKLFICVLLFFILFTSCESYLDENPKGYITPLNFYSTNVEAIGAVNSVYAALREESVNLPFMFLNEVSIDDITLPITTTGDRLEIENLVYSAQHNYLIPVWTNSYNAINRANTVLQYVDSANITPSLTRRIYGEARFLRAFHYFRLVRWFGDIPLMTKATQNPDPVVLYPSRNSVAQVYSQIIDDLKYAEINLDEKYAYTSSDYYRATQGAAKSLLAKVYLTMAGHPLQDLSKLPLAAQKCNEVISNSATYGYALMTNVKDIFDVSKESTNTENIWVLPATSQLSAGGWYFTRMHQWFFVWASLIPTNEVLGLDSYKAISIWGVNNSEKRDLRRKSALARKSSNSLQDIDFISGTPIVGKYIDMVNTSDAGNDYPFIRYTDVYYMLAESLMEQGGKVKMDSAMNIINQFRLRAAVDPILSYTDQAELRSIIKAERRKEFLFEGHRWTDLVRWGDLIPVMQAHGLKQYPKDSVNRFLNVSVRNTLFPLPFKETASNPNLKPQNFDY